MVSNGVFKSGFWVKAVFGPSQAGDCGVFRLAKAVNAVQCGKQNPIRNPATIRARGLKLLKRSLSPYIHIYLFLGVCRGDPPH